MNQIWNLSYKALAILSLLLSCSVMKPRENTSPTAIQSKVTTCQELERYNIVSNNEKLQADFREFILKRDLTFMETAVLWQLIQMNARPDLASINSDIYILLRYNKLIHYLHFSPKTLKSYSYLQASRHLLSKFGKNRSLPSLAKLLSREFKATITISDLLAPKLKEIRQQFLNSPSFRTAFLRGEQVLGTSESLPKLPFSNIIQRFQKEAREVLVDRQLQHYGDNFYCNNNDFNSISKKKVIFHPFALYDNKGNAMIALATQQFSRAIPWNKTMLFKRGETVSNLFMCTHSKKGTGLFSTAFDNRSSGQIMSGIISRIKSNTFDDLVSSIEHPRTIYLSNPARIMYEYDRSTEEKYQDLLKKGIPVYGKRSIGQVWSYFYSNKTTKLLLDPRSKAAQSCNIR